jgi:hypothetical protein
LQLYNCYRLIISPGCRNYPIYSSCEDVDSSIA